jgi:hypothetical protein
MSAAKFKTICLLFISFLVSLASLASAGSLDGYLYDTRPLLLFTTSSESPGYVQQIKMFDGNDCEFYVRDIEILTVVGDEQNTVDGQILDPTEVSFLRKELDVGSYKELLVLVGKDGKVKLRAHMPIKPRDLFMLVDAMPMRQVERLTRASVACSAA